MNLCEEQMLIQIRKRLKTNTQEFINVIICSENVILKEIFQFLTMEPFTGSSQNGVWIKFLIFEALDEMLSTFNNVSIKTIIYGM